MRGSGPESLSIGPEEHLPRRGLLLRACGLGRGYPAGFKIQDTEVRVRALRFGVWA